MIIRATPASVDSHLLGEGPVWDADRSRVVWVDIEAGDVLSGVLADDGTADRRHVDRYADEVRCFSPAGELLTTVLVDASHTTCVAFVGPTLDKLLITTGRTSHPGSSRLFTADVPAHGLPTPVWNPSA